jgi:predicted dehydrogenase
MSLVAGGELGPLSRLEAYFCTPLLRLGDIRYRYDLAGGAMMDLGCYLVHMLRKLAGDEPEAIQAQAACIRKNVDRRMDVELVFNHSPYADAGAPVPAHAVCSFFSSTPLRVLLVAHCERGEARLLNPVLPHKFHRLRIRVRDTWRTEQFPGESTYTHQLRAFVAALQSGKSPPTDSKDGLANMQVIDAVYGAAGLARREPAPDSGIIAPPTRVAGDRP